MLIYRIARGIFCCVSIFLDYTELYVEVLTWHTLSSNPRSATVWKVWEKSWTIQHLDLDFVASNYFFIIQWNYMRYMISTVLDNILGLCWSAKTVNYVWVAFSLSTCASMSFLSLPSCLAMKDKDQMWEASQIFLPVPNQKRERKKVSNIL